METARSNKRARSPLPPDEPRYALRSRTNRDFPRSKSSKRPVRALPNSDSVVSPPVVPVVHVDDEKSHDESVSVSAELSDPSLVQSEEFTIFSATGSVKLYPSDTIFERSPYRAPPRFVQEALWSLPQEHTALAELEILDEQAGFLKLQEIVCRAVPWSAYHPALRPSMRAILLDWLRECATGDGMSRTTYQTAVSIFDRFMAQRQNIPGDKLQLVGAAVLLLAGKLEESYRSCTVDKLLYSCNDLYTRTELLKVESLILKVLRWHINAPTPHVVAKLILARKEVASCRPSSVQFRGRGAHEGLSHYEFRRPSFPTGHLGLAMQLCDIASLDMRCLTWTTSTIAISALVATMLHCNPGVDMDELIDEFVPHFSPSLYEPLPLNVAEDDLPHGINVMPMPPRSESVHGRRSNPHDDAVFGGSALEASANQQAMRRQSIDRDRRSSVPSTPALVSLKSATRPEPTPANADLRACLQWMLEYTPCMDMELPCRNDSPHELQDWNKGALAFVRGKLRRRAEDTVPRAIQFT